MKTNTNSKKVTLVKIVAVAAFLALPGVSIAANAAPTPAERIAAHVNRTAVNPTVDATQRAVAPAVQFNLIDGQPIR